MQVATDAEVLKFLADNTWNHGIRAGGTTLYYADPGANCFELKFPETPLRISHFARVAAMMGIPPSGRKLVSLLENKWPKNHSDPESLK
jgi:hypothetical protein